MLLDAAHLALLQQAIRNDNVVKLRAPDRDEDYPAFAHRLGALRDLVRWGLARWLREPLEDHVQSGRYSAADAVLTDDGIREAGKRGRG